MKRAVYLSIVLFVLVSCNNKSSNTPLKSFRHANVKITDGPFYKAQQANLKYLLDLDQDRLLAPYLKDAGIKPIKENYTNWENSGLDGHIGGHYLSALAFMHASTNNKELLNRLNYLISELGRCQEKNGNGYVGGIPDGQKMWNEIAEGNINAGSFSLNERWVPLYNIHKLFAGLYDVYNVTGIEEAKHILVKLTDWFYTMTKNLTDEQIQTMLISEHGGLNDVFVDVYSITNDEKYLEMAKRFSHRAILDPLLKKRNELTGLHANTQIPKIIGFEKYAQATKNNDWADASEFFWKTVINDWTISIGGNSVREHFHPADDFTSMIESEEGPESCNTYNMLKLTRLLFLVNPDDKYMDYYERALFNHILSSEHPEKGGFVYFTPMRPRHYRVYSQPHTSFWCCVGSGLENPGKYSEVIYNYTHEDLYVNLFIASELDWKEKGVTLIQNTEFPLSESTKLTVKTKSPVRLNIKLRIPQWVNDDYTFVLNGEETSFIKNEHGYANIKKLWKNNDEVEFKFKMKTSVEFLPDSSHWASFVHGPIVLGAVTDTTDLIGLWADDSRMGHVAKGPKYLLNESPALVLEHPDKINAVLEPVDSLPMHFRISHLRNSNNKEFILKPFYQIHEVRYMVYWPVYGEREYKEMKVALAEREEEQRKLNERTIDLVWPGEQQPESDHFVKFEDSQTGVWQDRHFRQTTHYFSYMFKNPGIVASTLRVTYFGKDVRKFKILVNNEVVANVKLDGSVGDKFFDIDYPVPADAIAKSNGKPIEIKFMAEPNSMAGGIFGVRLLKN